jgi:hypothetical protein
MADALIVSHEFFRASWRREKWCQESGVRTTGCADGSGFAEQENPKSTHRISPPISQVKQATHQHTWLLTLSTSYAISDQLTLL